MTETTRKNIDDRKKLNRDPVTGAPGAHPVGTAAGATSGAVAGAASGMAVGGPIGGMVGIAAGAVAGGLAGKGVAEVINPTEEEKFWRETYNREPYYMKGKPYEYYAPAYRTGWEGRVRYKDRSFEEAEPGLMSQYLQIKSSFSPDWEDAKFAIRAAWNRVDQNRNPNPDDPDRLNPDKDNKTGD